MYACLPRSLIKYSNAPGDADRPISKHGDKRSATYTVYVRTKAALENLTRLPYHPCFSLGQKGARERSRAGLERDTMHARVRAPA